MPKRGILQDARFIKVKSFENRDEGALFSRAFVSQFNKLTNKEKKMAFQRKLALATLGAALAVSSFAGAHESKVTFTGDARFRTEKDSYFLPGTTTDNLYTRTRFRLKADAQVNDQWNATARLSTGTSQFGSHFTNGSSGSAGTAGFGARQQFTLDQAFLGYKAMDSLTLQLGKVPVSFWSAGNTVTAGLWNFDQSFEGLQTKWMGDSGALKPYFTATYATLVENASTADITMFGAQLGTKWSSDDLSANVAIGSYSFNNVKGLTPSAATTNFPASYAAFYGARGNTLLAGAYKFEYAETALDAEVTMNTGFAPVQVFGGYITNSNGDANTAMFGGLKLGALKDVGTWYVSGTYKDFGRDAFFAGYSEPTASMGGGTGFYGTEFQAGYQAFQAVSVVFNYHNTYHDFAALGGDKAPTDLYVLDLNATF